MWGGRLAGGGLFTLWQNGCLLGLVYLGWRYSRQLGKMWKIFPTYFSLIRNNWSCHFEITHIKLSFYSIPLPRCKGTYQKRFSGIRPLRGGGGYPPFPLRKKTFFFSHWFSVKGGVGVPPNSAKEKNLLFRSKNSIFCLFLCIWSTEERKLLLKSGPACHSSDTMTTSSWSSAPNWRVTWCDPGGWRWPLWRRPKGRFGL